MYCKRQFQRWIVAITCVGVIAPPQLFAEEAQATGQPGTQVSDIRLDQDGQLRGIVVNPQGQPLAGVEVQAWRQGKAVGRLITDRSGQFTLTQAKGGVYQLMTDTGGGVFRVWSAKAAPPAARRGAMLVQGHIVRGQNGYIPFTSHQQHGVGTGLYGGAFMRTLSNPWVMGGLLAAGVAIPIAASNDRDDEEGS